MKQEAKASLDAKFSELKQAIADYYQVDPSGDDIDPSGDDYVIPSPSYDYVDSSLQYLQNQLNDLWSSLYQHMSDGHLPPIEGADRMTKALKALGLDGDYDVQKKVIYANDGTAQGFDLKFRVNG